MASNPGLYIVKCYMPAPYQNNQKQQVLSYSYKLSPAVSLLISSPLQKTILVLHKCLLKIIGHLSIKMETEKVTFLN